MTTAYNNEVSNISIKSYWKIETTAGQVWILWCALGRRGMAKDPASKVHSTSDLLQDNSDHLSAT